jgi:hypothetical protein
MNDRLCDLLKIRHKLASLYHPQANGLDERFNQTFKRALEKLVNEKQNDWDVYIKHVLFAYRTSVNASTKYTPFYLIINAWETSNTTIYRTLGEHANHYATDAMLLIDVVPGE